jgi:hypothetical protein
LAISESPDFAGTVDGGQLRRGRIGRVLRRFARLFRGFPAEIQLNHPSVEDECTGVRILSESRPPAADRPGARRRGGRTRLRVALAALVAGVPIALAAHPAAAEVKLVPDTGTQGYAAEIGFQVTEDRAPVYTTSIQIVMPDKDPIAEVYPLSNDTWGPKIDYVNLPTPLPGLHGASSDQVVSRITWLRFGKPAGPLTTSTVDEVRVSLGPLPQSDNVRFLVVQTYSDGVVKRWVNPVMTLRPAAGQTAQPTDQAQGGTAAHGHGATIPGVAQPAAAPAESSGGHLGVVVGVLVALLVGFAIGGAVVAAGRMRPGGSDDGGEPAATPEDVDATPSRSS